MLNSMNVDNNNINQGLADDDDQTVREIDVFLLLMLKHYMCIYSHYLYPHMCLLISV